MLYNPDGSQLNSSTYSNHIDTGTPLSISTKDKYTKTNKHRTYIKIPKKAYNVRYLPYLDSDIPLQIFFGGSSSGKSFYLAQRDIRWLLKGGRNILECRNVKDTLRGSIYNEMCKVIDYYDLDRFFKCNVSPMSITCKNGYQAMFCGLDDVEKVKSITPKKGVFTDARIEEASEVKDTNVIKQIRKRLRGKTGNDRRKTITMSFNPIYKTHWIYKDHFAGIWQDDTTEYITDDKLIIKSTYKDNLRFLTEHDIYELENETDLYMYNVYTLGNWGVLGDLIFKNWETQNLTNIIPIFDYIRNGIDFGFSNDPFAYNRTHYDRKHHILYIFNELHGLGYSNKRIFDEVHPITGGSEVVVCDSAEPKSIADLCDYGMNAMGAAKGPDSIRHGIRWLQSLNKIIIHTGCQYTINEFELYQWKKNKAGERINQPIDAHNHHIDEIRYQYEDESLQRDQVEIIEVGEYSY